MADYYDTLNAADQAAFRNTLFAVVPATSCPGVDMSGATSPDAFTDSANRALAVDCAQVALGLPSGGVLDAVTYNAIMHPSAPATVWSTQKKVAVGAAIVGGAVALWWLLKKRR
jgi:hypothetical protein